MAKKLHAQALNGKNRRDIEQLATVVKNSSNRFSTYSNDTLQAIAYVLLKEGKNQPTQTDIDSAEAVVTTAQKQINKTSVQLVDLLGAVDIVKATKTKQSEFTPSPLLELLPTEKLSFTEGSIANLDWAGVNIPLTRKTTPKGMMCAPENILDKSRSYTKILLYMRYGSKYPQSGIKLLESDVAEIMHARKQADEETKTSWKESITLHFHKDTGATGDYTQKIDLLFQGLDQLSSKF